MKTKPKLKEPSKREQLASMIDWQLRDLEQALYRACDAYQRAQNEIEIIKKKIENHFALYKYLAKKPHYRSPEAREAWKNRASANERK